MTFPANPLSQLKRTTRGVRESEGLIQYEEHDDPTLEGIDRIVKRFWADRTRTATKSQATPNPRRFIPDSQR